MKKIEKVNIQDKLRAFSDYWNPRIAGELNGQCVKLVKLTGEFIWHSHDHEDEMFMVISGQLKMELRDDTLYLDPGEFVIIPKGTEHKPVADSEVHVMLFEPAGTLNTGNQQNHFTKEKLDKI
jgi:mannose-6-phosphate isomerase-like protein (cupin superfamily)